MEAHAQILPPPLCVGSGSETVCVCVCGGGGGGGGGGGDVNCHTNSGGEPGRISHNVIDSVNLMGLKDWQE